MKSGSESMTWRSRGTECSVLHGNKVGSGENKSEEGGAEGAGRRYEGGAL